MKNRFSCVLLLILVLITASGCTGMNSVGPNMNAAGGNTAQTVLKELPSDPDSLLKQARYDSASGDYVNAVRAYEAYRSENAYDDSLTREYGEVLLSLNRLEEAELLADNMLGKNLHSVPGVLLKSACLGQAGKEEAQKALLYDELYHDKTNGDIVSAIVDFHKAKGDNKTAISVYKSYLELVPSDVDALIDLAYCQMNLKKYKDAKETCNKAIEADEKNAVAYNALGNVYADLTEYDKALECYHKAYELDQSYQPARTNILWTYFNSNRFDECLEACTSQIRQGCQYFDLYYYQGGSYEALNEWDKAKDAYEKALAYPYNDYSTVYYHMGLISYNQQRYDEAQTYTQKALDTNPQNEDALWLSDELDKRKLPLSDRLTDFISDNYLYQQQTEDFGIYIDELRRTNGKAANEYIDAAVKAFHPQDPFSYFITGSEYETYSKEKETAAVEHITQSLKGKEYELFRIEAFHPLTGKSFVRLADKIENKDQKVLVFDLRGNTGGDMKACSEILDYLLGDCVTVNFIDRNGYTSSYYSSADKVVFKKIIILTDKNTASAAELLTLGLKVYQPDTWIIGQNTFGKGVSQVVFDDPQNKVALCLVNSYWNVREINIHGYGIAPDEKAKSQAEYDLALQNVLNVVQ
ncbi:MAG: tetratricopeptide repeat protein [Clostridia bacterium]|nr:tetratricopeptide repeat protein [Clostridia bacterium]